MSSLQRQPLCFLGNNENNDDDNDEKSEILEGLDRTMMTADTGNPVFA